MIVKYFRLLLKNRKLEKEVNSLRAEFLRLNNQVTKLIIENRWHQYVINTSSSTETMRKTISKQELYIQALERDLKTKYNCEMNGEEEKG